MSIKADRSGLGITSGDQRSYARMMFSEVYKGDFIDAHLSFTRACICSILLPRLAAPGHDFTSAPVLDTSHIFFIASQISCVHAPVGALVITGSEPPPSRTLTVRS